DVEDASWKRVDQQRADHAHETGETDEADVARLQRLGDRSIEGVTRRVDSSIQRQGLEAGFPGAIQSRSIHPVGNHDRDRGVQHAVRYRVDDRLEIASATRDENAEAAVHDISDINVPSEIAHFTGTPLNLADSAGVCASRPIQE